MRALGQRQIRWVLPAVLLAGALGAQAEKAPNPLDPVGTYMADGTAHVKDVVREGGTQGKGVVMEFGLSVLNAIEAFKAMYRKSLGDTSKELTGQRATLFAEIQKSIGQLDAALVSSTSSLQGSSDTLAAAVAQALGSRAFPRVRTMTPLFSVAGDRTAKLTVKGLFLSYGQPTLLLQGKQQPAATAGDGELIFSSPFMPADLKEPVMVQAELTVYEQISRRFWFDAVEEKRYPLELAVYPREIGQAQLIPTLRVKRGTSVPKASAMLRCESPQGEGSRDTVATITASPDSTIDVSSIKYVSHYSNHGTHTFGSQGPSGFIINLHCEGFDKGFLNAGQNGVESGYVTYVETTTMESVEQGPAQDFPLFWGDSLVMPLPADTIGVKLAVTPSFLKPKQRFESGPGSMRFADLDFDPVAKTATVRARPIEAALRGP